MAFRLHLAPFLQQLASFIKKKGAPFDPHHLFSIHVLFFQDLKAAAQGAVFITEKQQVQLLLLNEFFV